MKSPRWPAAAAVGLAVATALLTGCSDVEKALNKGGDTKCSEYVKQDQNTKRTTVTKFVKQQTGDENEPAGTQVDLTMAAVEFLCGNQRNADTQIKNADVAGIFFNK